VDGAKGVFMRRRAWEIVSLILRVLDHAPEDSQERFWRKFSSILSRASDGIYRLFEKEADFQIRALISLAAPFYLRKFEQVEKGDLSADELKAWLQNSDLTRLVERNSPTLSRIGSDPRKFFCCFEVTRARFESESPSEVLNQCFAKAFIISESQVQKSRSLRSVSKSYVGPNLYSVPGTGGICSSDIGGRGLLRSILNRIFRSYPSDDEFSRICEILGLPREPERLDSTGNAFVESGLKVDHSKFIRNLNA
jgi:hypothetical protein